MNKLQLTMDGNGNTTYGIGFAESGKIISLETAASATIVVPNTASVALFQFTPGATVLVSNSSAPTAPGSLFSDSTADINPSLRSVIAGQTLYFYAVTAAIVKVSFYQGS